jgi:hypothetical protein
VPRGVKLGFMTGGALLGLVLLSLGWLFFFGGLAANYQALRRYANTASTCPGPWLWILLPLAIDPWLVLLVLRSK